MILFITSLVNIKLKHIYSYCVFQSRKIKHSEDKTIHHPSYRLNEFSFYNMDKLPTYNILECYFTDVASIFHINATLSSVNSCCATTFSIFILLIISFLTYCVLFLLHIALTIYFQFFLELKTNRT